MFGPGLLMTTQPEEGGGSSPLGSHVDTVTVSSAYVSADVPDYPLRIALNHAGFAALHANLDAGGSLRVTLADGITEIPYQLIRPSSGIGLVICKITLSAVTNTRVKLHTGNLLSDYAVTDPYGRNNAFRAAYRMFHTLHTSPALVQENATGDSDLDMTSTGGMLASDVMVAAFGGHTVPLFDGIAGQHMEAGAAAVTGYPCTMGIIRCNPVVSGAWGLGLSMCNTSSTSFGKEISSYSVKNRISNAWDGGIGYGSFRLDPGDLNWHSEIAVFTSASSRQHWLDNVASPVGTAARPTPHPSLDNTVISGRINNGGTPGNFVGEQGISEAFILDEIMSDAERTATHHNFFTPSFYTVT